MPLHCHMERKFVISNSRKIQNERVVEPLKKRNVWLFRLALALPTYIAFLHPFPVEAAATPAKFRRSRFIDSSDALLRMVRWPTPALLPFIEQLFETLWTWSQPHGHNSRYIYSVAEAGSHPIPYLWPLFLASLNCASYSRRAL